MSNLNNFGEEYHNLALDPAKFDQNPINQFETWFNEAVSSGQKEANAMAVATTDANYNVTNRIMLLKYFDNNGFVFFSNYNSAKGKAFLQTKDNIQNTALVFWWPINQRQVRITGQTMLLDAKHSDEYFHKRPIGSQIAAVASKQSHVINSRDELVEKYKKIETQYLTKQIPRPEYWGGYILKPNSFEFWQGCPNRLHDRIKYVQDPASPSNWQILRLAP